MEEEPHPVDPQTYTNTWAFNAAETGLYIASTSPRDELKITRLTATTLQLAQRFDLPSGGSYGLDVTYTAL